MTNSRMVYKATALTRNNSATTMSHRQPHTTRVILGAHRSGQHLGAQLRQRWGGAGPPEGLWSFEEGGEDEGGEDTSLGEAWGTWPSCDR